MLRDGFYNRDISITVTVKMQEYVDEERQTLKCSCCRDLHLALVRIVASALMWLVHQYGANTSCSQG